MAHGGIDSGPKMFSGGLDTKALAEMDADQIKTMNATHFVSVDRGGPDDTEFVIDFEGCTKAFL